MTILLESIKPVIIHDPKNRGRKWLKNFDASFATVCESQPDYYTQLANLLSNGHNILIELTNQDTIDNMQTNYINSLIFLSEDMATVEINGDDVNVNKESKVYIVVNSPPKTPSTFANSNKILHVPENIRAEYLSLNYCED